MSPDELQQAWQAETSRTRVTVDADVLRKEVQRSHREFNATVRWYDYREVAVAAVMIPIWFILGITFGMPWTWYLVVPAVIWGMGFILVNRRRHKRNRTGPDSALLDTVKESLGQVEHEIWMKRNIVWWYLLPYAIPILIFFTHVTWSVTGNPTEAIIATVLFYLFLIALYSFTYFLSLYNVRKQLEPRRRELLTLLANLGDETNGDVKGEYPILMAAKSPNSRRRTIIAGICALVLLAIGIAGTVILAKLDKDRYPKLAPFTDVSWKDDSPLIELDGQWVVLNAIDGIAAKDIVEFCKRTYKGIWQKRFAEDLVEVLTAMGHKPGGIVKLEVFSVTRPIGKVTKEVSMTAENRSAVRKKADKRKQFEEWKKDGDRAKNEPAIPLSEIVPTLRKENKLVGLAAMVMVDGKTVESAADGERKSGGGVAVTVEDRWHLGSITKSITATMIAKLIETGKMQWDETVGEVFSDASMHEEWKAVTVRQLLTHTSGAPANFPASVMFKRPAIGADSTAARLVTVLDVISKKPESKPGSTHAYSNVGFTIAGAMAEKATGETWDALVKREVFEPLSLSSAGFGPPKSVEKNLAQPQGHTSIFGWKVGAGEDADNTFIIGPAGIVHMSLKDLCGYATEHLRGERGEGKLLSAETYKQLHKPELDDYACGWVKVEASVRIPYAHYWHNGSNTMWYALVVFIPETKMVVAVASNDGDMNGAEAAAWEIVKNCVKQGAQKAKAAVGLPPRQ